MAKEKDIKLERSELSLNLNSFNSPIPVDDYFDVKGHKYMSVVVEMALHGDLHYTCEKTGISYSELLRLIEKPDFQKDVEREKKAMEVDGNSTITTKSKIYSHIMLDELKEIAMDKMQKTSDRLQAMKMNFEISKVLNNKEDTKVNTAQVVQINFKSSRDNNNDTTFTIENGS